MLRINYRVKIMAAVFCCCKLYAGLRGQGLGSDLTQALKYSVKKIPLPVTVKEGSVYLMVEEKKK